MDTLPPPPARLSPLLHMISTATDEQLVDRCRRGDREAFTELVERWQGRIHTICLRWLGDPQVAEDVAQDVFVSAWRGLPSFRGEARFDTWLRRITVNKCRNRRVSQRRRGHGLHDPVDATPHLQLVHGGPGPDAAVHRQQADALIHAALHSLAEEHRAVIVLRDLEDLSYGEIADLLDLAPGTVRSRLHRARSALAEALGRHLVQEDVLG